MGPLSTTVCWPFNFKPYYVWQDLLNTSYIQVLCFYLFLKKMSATSTTLPSLSSLSIESIHEDREVHELENEGNDLAEFEFENDTGQQSKATHRRSLLIMFLLTFVLILSVAIAFDANKSSTKTKFISTTTLFYNMTVPPTEFIT